MTKTSDEILLFLVKNSKPEYHVHFVEDPEDGPKRTRNQKLMDLLLNLSGTTRFLCETSKLQEFLGEKVHFEKHLRPLQTEGTLCFDNRNMDTGPYNTPEYREVFAHTRGQIKDYETNVSYVAFHYRENNFLQDYRNIVTQAVNLGIVKAK